MQVPACLEIDEVVVVFIVVVEVDVEKVVDSTLVAIVVSGVVVLVVADDVNWVVVIVGTEVVNGVVASDDVDDSGSAIELLKAK